MEAYEKPFSVTISGKIVISDIECSPKSVTFFRIRGNVAYAFEKGRWPYINNLRERTIHVALKTFALVGSSKRWEEASNEAGATR